MEAALAEISGTAPVARRAKGKAPQLVVDPDTVTLELGKIVLKHTDDGGYFCMGFGPSAQFLRALDEDDGFNEAIDKAAIALSELNGPIGSNQDRFVRRLGIAVALAKEGFDPNQPRDDHGRWTSEGAGGGAAAASIADSIIAAPGLVPALQELGRRLLSGATAVAADAVEIASGPVAATVSGAAAFLGVVFIPTNRSLISEGTVPDAPDLGYHYDQGTGVLTLTQTNADGTKNALFEARPGTDSLFRDKDGNVVGRFLGDSIVIDPDVVSGYESRAKDKDRSNAGARAQAIPIADTNQPKLCPDPSADKSGNKSPGAIVYQMYVGMVVNGEPLPLGLGIRMARPNGEPVYFDDCRQATGALIEAKGSGYWDQLKKGPNSYPWIGTLGKILDQAKRQIEAAKGRPIEWHFAEKEVADYIRPIFAKRYPSIAVIHTPPPRKLIGQLKRIIGSFGHEFRYFSALHSEGWTRIVQSRGL